MRLHRRFTDPWSHHGALTITIDSADLEPVMTGQSTWDDLVAAGTVSLEGNQDVLCQLISTLTQFTPDFELMPGGRFWHAADSRSRTSRKDPLREIRLERETL